MKKQFARFMTDDSGATAIEYGLIASLIAVVCIAAWSAIGESLKGHFEYIQEKLEGVTH